MNDDVLYAFDSPADSDTTILIPLGVSDDSACGSQRGYACIAPTCSSEASSPSLSQSATKTSSVATSVVASDADVVSHDPIGIVNVAAPPQQQWHKVDLHENVSADGTKICLHVNSTLLATFSGFFNRLFRKPEYRKTLEKHLVLELPNEEGGDVAKLFFKWFYTNEQSFRRLCPWESCASATQQEQRSLSTSASATLQQQQPARTAGADWSSGHARAVSVCDHEESKYGSTPRNHGVTAQLQQPAQEQQDLGNQAWNHSVVTMLLPLLSLAMRYETPDLRDALQAHLLNAPLTRWSLDTLLRILTNERLRVPMESSVEPSNASLHDVAASIVVRTYLNPLNDTALRRRPMHGCVLSSFLTFSPAVLVSILAALKAAGLSSESTWRLIYTWMLPKLRTQSLTADESLMWQHLDFERLSGDFLLNVAQKHTFGGHFGGGYDSFVQNAIQYQLSSRYRRQLLQPAATSPTATGSPSLDEENRNTRSLSDRTTLHLTPTLSEHTTVYLTAALSQMAARDFGEPIWSDIVFLLGLPLRVGIERELYDSTICLSLIVQFIDESYFVAPPALPCVNAESALRNFLEEAADAGHTTDITDAVFPEMEQYPVDALAPIHIIEALMWKVQNIVPDALPAREHAAYDVKWRHGIERIRSRHMQEKYPNLTLIRGGFRLRSFLNVNWSTLQQQLAMCTKEADTLSIAFEFVPW